MSSLPPSSPPEGPSGKGRFDALYRQTLSPLRGYLTRFLRNSSEAEDVAQDAYVRIYPLVEQNLAQKPEALLYTTARRLALNKIKRLKISPLDTGKLEVEHTPSPTPGVVETINARQELRQLDTAIAGLPPGCRTVLLLRKIELLSHKEISERLGIAISTVEKQHARALRLLREALTSHATPVAPASLSLQDKELGS